MAPKTKNRKSQKPRRAPRRKARVPRTLVPKDTTYRFKFNPASQVLIQAPVSGAGAMAFSSASGAGGSPLKSSDLVILPSSNGLAGFYDVSCACYHTLGDLNYNANFATMFDCYKITKVSVHVESLRNTASYGGVGQLMPTMYLYHDVDDAVSPPSVTSISGKQGVKIRQFGNQSKTTLSLSYRPLVATSAAVIGGTGNVIVPSKSVWCNSTDATVKHNALKWLITDLYLPDPATISQAFRFNFVYHISFKRPLLTA